MTFQRWARLLIGVLKGDDFMVSTVKADREGEAACAPTPWQLKTCYLQVYRKESYGQNNKQDC